MTHARAFPNRLWVRHRCPGARAAGIAVYFNDFEVRVPALPGVTRGCPFCWSDVFRLRGDWWENYRRRAPVATPEECAAAAVDAVRRLERPGCPSDAVCSHHGVYGRIPAKDMYVQLMNKGQHLQVIISKSLYPRPAALHAARAEAVATALVTSVRETWNGREGSEGISVVLGRSAPDALLASIANYRNLGFKIFDRSPEITVRFAAFSDWYDRPLEAA